MKNLFTLLLVLISFSGISQTYYGKVVDSETRKPIPLATVLITDLNTGVACNLYGEFKLSFSLPKAINIKISALGYSSSVLTVRLENLNNAVFTLSPSHIVLQEMEISSSTGVLQNYSITNVETKSLEELNTIPSTSLGQSLENISGVYSNSTGNGINKPVIRGLGGMRVSTYLNGLKIENQQWGNDHGIGVDALGIEKVEIIKGPSSLLYGSDAMGGVIYLKEENYTTANTLEGGISSQFETNSLGLNNGFSFKIAKKNIRFNLFGNILSHADYKIPNGKFTHNSRFNGKAIKAAIGYNKDNYILNLRYTFLTNELGIPGHSHDSLPSEEDLYNTKQIRKKTLPLQINKNHYVSLENKLFFNSSDLKLTLGVNSHNLQEFEEKVTIPAINLSLNTYSYNLIWSNKKHKTHTFIFGTQGNYQQNSNDPKAEEILLNNLSTNNQGIFGMVYSKFTKKLNTQAGIRLDRNQFLIPKNTTINEDLELNYQSINYSAGISYTSSKHSYRFNISSGYRPPHPIESLADGIHHASRKYEIGDINLKPEYANQIDFSYEYNNEHFDVNFNPYFSAISNYTFLSFSDSTINGYQVYNYKQNKQAFLYGTEINLHYHPHFLHNLHLETNLSYLFAENQNKKNIANIPQPKINSTITYNFHSKSKLLPKLIAIQHTYFGAQNRVVENEISSVDYQLLDIGINWKIDVKQIKGSFKLGTKNIFNKKYINHLSELKILGIPNPGRNFYITLKLNFNSKINKNEKTN